MGSFTLVATRMIFLATCSKRLLTFSPIRFSPIAIPFHLLFTISIFIAMLRLHLHLVFGLMFCLLYSVVVGVAIVD